MAQALHVHAHAKGQFQSMTGSTVRVMSTVCELIKPQAISKLAPR